MLNRHSRCLPVVNTQRLEQPIVYFLLVWMLCSRTSEPSDAMRQICRALLHIYMYMSHLHDLAVIPFTGDGCRVQTEGLYERRNVRMFPD